MKNLLKKIGIEKLKTVPIEHLSDRPTQARRSDWFGWKHHEGWYKLGKTSPYKILSRVIENNIGKPFDMAFSYYCTLVPQMYQNKFLEEFEDNKGPNTSDYYIDNKGNIQKRKTWWWKKKI